MTKNTYETFTTCTKHFAFPEMQAMWLNDSYNHKGPISLNEKAKARAHSLQELVEFMIPDIDILGHVPREMNHGYNGLVPLQFIPLVPFQGQPVLVVRQRTHIPGYIIAPALSKKKEKGINIRSCNLLWTKIENYLIHWFNESTKYKGVLTYTHNSLPFKV